MMYLAGLLGVLYTGDVPSLLEKADVLQKELAETHAAVRAEHALHT
jgi:hypothetical protein